MTPLPGLPMPITKDQEFYYAILDELRAIRQLLAPDGPPESSAFLSSEIVELREPRKRKGKGKAK